MAESGAKAWPRLGPGTIGRSRPSFLTRSATDDAGELLRRASVPALAEANTAAAEALAKLQAPESKPSQPNHEVTPAIETQQNVQSPNRSRKAEGNANEEISKKRINKIGANLRPVGGTDKLSTFSGVFVPTSLNVLSILMFIRFGFILGQSGVIGMLAMLVAAYIINLFTTLSISAIASNGTVRGGGTYYLISRSLGPEFGGSIGIISYLGFVFNTGMNAVGLIDCLIYCFGSESGIWANWLIEGGWWQYLWSTIVVILCTAICLAGSAIFARASNGLLLVLLVATFSIPLSAALVSPFRSVTATKQYTDFTGLSLETIRANLLPHFTRGAAGSQTKGRENWANMFGILFPAAGGIFAGASMSGDLKNPGKSIPRGTLYGILLTFFSYALVIIAMGASITRATLYKNVNVIQDVNMSGVLVLCGEIASTFFSVLMGIVGPAKQLQAIARDDLFPGLSPFGQGTKKTDDPVYAILVTWFVAQLTLLFDINSLASFVTMSYLLMNLALHLACLLLKLSSAPNFRPSFRYFNQWTAFFGAILSVASMFFVDGVSASGSIVILLTIFMLIHYTTPPKPWGSDVTSGLVYHQIRKYLLRLRTESVKYWRPQILLFVNDPRRGFKLISFANSLKKGGLFILGHVIVTDNFGASIPEARKQQAAWTKFIEYANIKSFINVAISPSIEWGARNIFLSAGLGGMRPNIVMMGFYNLQQFRQEQPLIDIPSPPPERKRDTIRRRRRSEVRGALPTDACFVEKRTDMQSYVLVLEDMILRLKTNVAIAINFSDLELPNPKEGNTKKYIDLWPIQMSAEISTDDNGEPHNLRTTNFDTYTLILQLGCILNTVPAWKKSYQLRVAVFVEYESDVEEERQRVMGLLENLRINADVLVFWLACGNYKSYRYVVNGEEVDETTTSQTNQILEDEDWWKELQNVRGQLKSGNVSAIDILSLSEDVQWPQSSSMSKREASMVRFGGLRKILMDPRRRSSFGNISSLGVVPSMRTHRLDDDLISRHASHAGSDSEYGESEDESDVGSMQVMDDDDETDLSDEDHNLFLQGKASEDGEGPVDSRIRTLSSKKSSVRSSLASSKKSKSSRHKHKHTSNTNEPTESDTLIKWTDADEDDPARGRTAARDVLTNRLMVESPLNSPSETSGRKSRNPSPNFTSAPLPITKVASEENAGPSIMFADDPHPRRRGDTVTARPDSTNRSIYAKSASPIRGANGFPAAASVPLSFNDLPCRAQHLILNEVIAQNSEDTAVIFTTLPAPIEGTYKNEANSLSYLSDLEVLTQELGPMMLVHSNSMTVTTNL